MAESKAHLIAQALIKLAESLPAGPLESDLRSKLLSLAHDDGPSVTAKLSPRQVQAIKVFRVLWPVKTQPRMKVEEAVALLRELFPGDRPLDEMAALTAALSPADDRTVSSVDDAMRFIKALNPAGEISASDAAQLILALSPAENPVGRNADNVAALIRALCPADREADRAALIRALSPADDSASNPVEIARLIRELSPADVTPVQVVQALSPAE